MQRSLPATLPMDWVVSPKKCTPWLFWGSINGEGGSPLNYIRLGPRFLLALSHEHILNTITMATAAAMVWSGTVVGTTINRRQTPQWTYMTLWCEGIFLEGLWTLFLGFLLRKWPLLIKMRQLHRPPLQHMTFGPYTPVYNSTNWHYIWFDNARWVGCGSFRPESSAWPTRDATGLCMKGTVR